MWCKVWNRRPSLIIAPFLIDVPTEKIVKKSRKRPLMQNHAIYLTPLLLGQQSLSNYILFDLKFKVRISLFHFLNFCARNVGNFLSVCSGSMASRKNKDEDSMIYCFKNGQPCEEASEQTVTSTVLCAGPAQPPKPFSGHHRVGCRRRQRWKHWPRWRRGHLAFIGSYTVHVLWVLKRR